MKIRDDLEGVVYVQAEGGVVVLSAGDTVPAGAEVGEHLTKKAEPKNAEVDDGAGIKRGRSRSPRPSTDD